LYLVVPESGEVVVLDGLVTFQSFDPRPAAALARFPVACSAHSTSHRTVTGLTAELVVGPHAVEALGAVVALESIDIALACALSTHGVAGVEQREAAGLITVAV